MHTFYCKIATPDGTVTEQMITAESKTSLKMRLENEGHFVLEMHHEKKFWTTIAHRRGIRRFKQKDFLFFNQEFAVLVKAGLSIVAALDVVLEKKDKNELIETIRKVREDISTGESVSKAFSKFPHIFSGFYVACLSAGEKSGNIPLAVLRYVEYMKKTEKIRQKVVSASVYPLILTCVSGLVLLFLLLFVVPSLTETFIESGSQLPLLTQMLINISHMLKSGFFYIFLAIIAAYTGFLYFKKTDSGHIVIDRWKLLLPFLGKVYIHYSIARLSLTIATVLGSGMSLMDTLKTSSDTLTNFFLKQKFATVVKHIERGAGFSESLAKDGFFPALAVRMVAAGESSGSLEQVLMDIADFYETQVDARLSMLTSTIEPALMIFMGMLIGFIVLAMYLPIFQLAGTVT
jgi:type IV pilus assembly protein PilC